MLYTYSCIREYVRIPVVNTISKIPVLIIADVPCLQTQLDFSECIIIERELPKTC